MECEQTNCAACPSLMSSFAVALVSANDTDLRLLCTILSCAGFAVVLLALRLDRKARCASQESNSPSAASSAQDQSLKEGSFEQHVIHLSSEPSPTKSSEMSQQQKIAAALSRAGIGGPVGWPQATPSPTVSVTMDRSPDRTINSGDDGHARTTKAHSNLPRKLLLLGGLMLALLSLMLFLILR